MAVPVQTFAAQATPEAFLTAFFYIFACMGVMLGIVSLTLVDAGLVRNKNIIDTIVQKLVSALIGGIAFLIIGYGLWNWQFYQALGVPNAFSQAISDWGFLGHNMNTFSQHLDPVAVPNADMQQVFSIFFFLFGAIGAAFMHSAGVERLKAVPCYIMSAIIGGLAMPALAYLTYGSGSPLTNAGLHDFVGTFSLYIFIGVWAIVLARKLGPRHDRPTAPGNFALVAAGVLIMMVAVPMLVVGCGFLEPGAGYFGISTVDSGLGITFVNVFTAFSGGGLSGAVIAYRLRKPIFALLGPIAGYISCSALFDLAMPWQVLVVSVFGPVALLAGDALMRRFNIDEIKVAPLTLGPGLLSVLAAGVIGAGRPTGGFFGVTSGAYAFQHAHISFSMQLLGAVVDVIGTAVVAFIIVEVLDRTIGLRVTKVEEEQGLDATYWSSTDAAILDINAQTPVHPIQSQTMR
jgi:Amt family ammonium transporter